MQATQVATAFHRPGWVYEEKVDGYRMVTYKVGASVRLVSRQGKEFTLRFPDLAQAVGGLGAESVILDTEVAVFDRQLVSRFEWLRGHPKDDVATPPMLMAFDLLELDGEDQRKRPLRERRQALEHLLSGERRILPVRRLNSSGLEAWKEVPEQDPLPLLEVHPRPAAGPRRGPSDGGVARPHSPGPRNRAATKAGRTGPNQATRS